MSDQYSGHRGQRATYTGTHINYKVNARGYKSAILLRVTSSSFEVYSCPYILPRSSVTDPCDICAICDIGDICAICAICAIGDMCHW